MHFAVKLFLSKAFLGKAIFKFRSKSLGGKSVSCKTMPRNEKVLGKNPNRAAAISAQLGKSAITCKLKEYSRYDYFW